MDVDVTGMQILLGVVRSTVKRLGVAIRTDIELRWDEVHELTCEARRITNNSHFANVPALDLSLAPEGLLLPLLQSCTFTITLASLEHLVQGLKQVITVLKTIRSQALRSLELQWDGHRIPGSHSQHLADPTVSELLQELELLLLSNSVKLFLTFHNPSRVNRISSLRMVAEQAFSTLHERGMLSVGFARNCKYLSLLFNEIDGA